MHFIFAGIHAEAVTYARSERWEPGSWVYVASASELRGHEGKERNIQSLDEFHFVGNWRHREDRKQIVGTAKAQGFL